MYRIVFNLLLKRLNPEFAHHLGTIGIRLLALFSKPTRPSETASVAGLSFTNRIGMAAGFDKNAKLIRPLYRLGFGHVEIGTVTPLPQPGNPKPRLFRIPVQRALINRMGFNNDGADVIAQRLAALRRAGGDLPVIGVNIGKNKTTGLADAAKDYEVCARKLAPFADYLAINVSSPNTPGLRDLQQIESLKPILEVVVANSQSKPVFLKIAPDISDADALEIGRLAVASKLAGVIATNTTVSRDGITGRLAQEAGGLSGPPVATRSKALLQLLGANFGEELALVSVGGIETSADVQERLAAGADLVQGYTGFVYFGPFWAKALSRGVPQG